MGSKQTREKKKTPLQQGVTPTPKTTAPTAAPFVDVRDSHTKAVTLYGGSGRAAMAFGKNIASPKIPGLFDGEEIAHREERIAIEKAAYRMERNGKPIFLSPGDVYTCMILSSTINVYDDDVAAFIKWTEQVELNGLTPHLQSTMPNPIARTYNLRDLAKARFGRGKKEQIEALRESLYRLREIEQVQRLGEHQLEISASLLVGRDLSVKDLSDEERGLDTERIVFGSIFLWNLGKRFCYLTDKLFEIWRKKGNQNELFATLVATFVNIMWPHQQAAKAARIAARKELAEAGLSDEEKRVQIQERVTEALTYREKFSYIKSQLRTDYDSERQYRAKFKSDLNRAINGLKEIGFITDGYISKSKDGGEMAVFVISETYGGQLKLGISTVPPN